MSMVDGFPYKEEVGGSNPSVPTIYESQEEFLLSSDRRSIVREGMIDGRIACPTDFLTFRVCMRSRSSVG